MTSLIDPERLVAMVLYTHRAEAERYVHSRQIEARLKGQPSLLAQWHTVAAMLRSIRTKTQTKEQI